MSSKPRYRPVRYFSAVFLISFALWGLAGYLSFREAAQDYYMLLVLLGLMTPAAVAAVMIGRGGDAPLRRDFLRRLLDPRLIAPGTLSLQLLLMPLSVLVSIALSVAFGGPAEQFAPSGSFSFSAGFVPVLLLLVLAATFEELGWRGYGFESLQRLGFVRASLLFGLLWSLWHLPLSFVKGSYQYEIWQENAWYAVNFYVSVVVLGVIVSWVAMRNHGSILAVILFHLLVNLSQEALSIAEETKIIQTGVLVALAVLIVVADRRRLMPERAAPERAHQCQRYRVLSWKDSSR